MRSPSRPLRCAAHPVAILEMADHGFDGGAAADLKADGFGDTTDLDR
jgi:hypothetical protein